VQTGDQLDRGDHDREILDLLERITSEASAAGGRVIALNGNHETMNVAGDFRYVTEAGFAQFSQFESQAPNKALLERVAPAARGRFAAFAPGGVYAQKLAQREVVAIVGETVFAHGGVLEKHVQYGLDRLNTDVSRWMRGESAAPSSITAEDAPVWTREYSEEPLPEQACTELYTVLRELGAKRMVVGHTVQKHGVTSACDGKVFRIDVGLSDYYGENATQCLEIDGERISVRSAEPHR
jgi:hypothetical protein